MPTLDRDGVMIHYEVHGRDTGRLPLVLTHGYAASATMWEPNLEALGAERRVITWDLRGHGRSDSPDDPAAYTQDLAVADLTALLATCGAERAVVGGHSLGGYLSLAFRRAHPHRVGALALIDTGPGFKQDEGRAGWNDLAESFAVGFETRGLDALSTSPEVGTAVHDPRGLALAARGILTQHDAAIISSLGDVTVPTLVLVGDRDRPFLNAADYMAAKIPGATKVVVPDAGHAPNLDQPAAFDAAMAAFLAGVD